MKKLLFLLLFSSVGAFAQTQAELENLIISKLEYDDYDDAYNLLAISEKLYGISERSNYLTQSTNYYFLMRRFRIAGLKPSMLQVVGTVNALTKDIDKTDENQNKYKLFRCLIAYSLLSIHEYKSKLSEAQKNDYTKMILADAETVAINFPDYTDKIQEIKRKINQ